MNLTDIHDIHELLARHGFRFSRSMGQNFLCADWVPERIAEEAGLDRETGVLEIGPGIGCLTRPLAQRAGRVVSVELDESLLPVLAETLTGCDNVQVVFGDILKRDLPALVAEELSGFPHRVVCANLPYNITTPLLTELVTGGLFERVVVMVQKEVALRVCAKENTADYGAFTVLMQWYCETAKLFDVPPSCFVPAPKVTSAVLRLKRRERPPYEVRDEALFFALVRAAFNQRRKTLVNAVANNLGGRFDKEDVAAALRYLELDERIRGEALSIEDFAELSNVLASREGPVEKT